MYGEVHRLVVDYDRSSTTDSWTFVHEWDGSHQLIPPGSPLVSKVTDEAWVVLKSVTLA